MSKALCFGNYSAQRIPGDTVLLIARGQHATGGFKVTLEPDRMPDSYTIYHEKNSGPSTQAFTPFVVYAFWKSSSGPKSVHVKDSNGDQHVPVEEVPDLARCMDIDTPFPLNK